MKRQMSRRELLSGLASGLGTLLITPLERLSPFRGETLASNNKDSFPPEVMTSSLEDGRGALYEGFILLPENAKIPRFVSRGNGIELGQSSLDNATMSGETIQFTSIEELKQHVTTPRLYIPTSLPPGIGLIDIHLVRYQLTQRTWEVAVFFGDQGNSTNLISTRARPVFHRPFPIWPVRLPSAPDDGPIYPEKVNVQGRPMILLPTISGHFLQWIEDDVLYSLAVEFSTGRSETMMVAETLVQL
jgi:hypothetical protein